jgi:hypothetical protein
VNQRVPAEVEAVWDRFHQVVNMTSDELRTWLLTQSSGEDAFTADPDLGLPDLGRKVVRILGKRKVDLTGEDAEVMLQVEEFVSTQEANPPADESCDDRWRRSLMTVGHDPLKPGSPD